MLRAELRSVAFLSAMPSERKPIVRLLHLTRRAVTNHGVPNRGGAFTDESNDGLILGNGCTHSATVNGVSVTAGHTGIGTANAYRVTTAVIGATHPDLVVVVGVAGGIDRAWRIGSVVTPSGCTNHATGISLSPTAWPDIDPHGRLLTTDDFITDPTELRALAADGFVAVDMETSAIAQACSDGAVPWLAFRGISDDVFDPTVDDRVAELTKPDGAPHFGRVASFLASDPRRVGLLRRLARDLDLATRAASDAAVAAVFGPLAQTPSPR